MQRKIIVNSNCYHGYSIDEAIEGIIASGANAIELTATKGWTEHVFPDKTFKELQRIKDSLEDNKIEVVAMSGHTNIMDEKRIPDFISNIHLANFYNAQYIVTSVGEAHLEDMASTSNELVAENIKAFLPLLENYDMSLVIEVHGHEHGTGAIVNDIVKRVGSDRVKIAYDTANAIFYGRVDVLEDMKACLDNITYVHAKDKAGPVDVWNFPTIGTGDVDFDGILNLLDEAGNPAPLSIEIEFTEKGPKDLNEVNEAVKASVEYLKKRVGDTQ